MLYKVQLAPAAERQIKKLERAVQKRIIERLESLEQNPRPHGILKLEGSDNTFRVKVGDYRIVYEIQDENVLVLVLRVGDRKEIFR